MKKKLLDIVREKIRLKHYSRKTEQAYVGWIKRYIFFHDKRHPADMGKAEIEAFLTWLAVERNVSPTTQNQAFNALLFLYEQVAELLHFLALIHAPTQKAAHKTAGFSVAAIPHPMDEVCSFLFSIAEYVLLKCLFQHPTAG